MAALDHSKALGAGVIAWTSDRTVDFHHGDPAVPGRFALIAPQRAWLTAHGVSNPDSVIFPKQVHGDKVWRVTSKDAARAGYFEADAVVTAEVGLPIAVRTADCLPLLLHDPVRRVIAAVHAGWKSAKLAIAARTLEVMRAEYGVRPSDLRAVIGPCIRRDSYQVGPEFREHFPGDVHPTDQGLCLDLAGANIRQLHSAGVERGNIADCGLCTFSEAGRFFSFRREAEAAGRLFNLIMLV